MRTGGMLCAFLWIFLCRTLRRRKAELRLNGYANPSFLGVGLYSSTVPCSEDTVYMCAGSLSAGERENLRCKGLIWLGTRTPPGGMPVLWLRDAWDFSEIFNEVQSIFQRFHHWSGLVYEAVAKRRPLMDIFSLLTMVTPNPWYLADPSFRMLAIKDEPDYCEISPIWRYQAAHGHLPIDVIFRMISSGELQKMNETPHALCFCKTTAFVNAFVSKTIFSPKGVIGHFYIIGMYGEPTAYELEIAEFFGNRLTDLLSGCPEYLPTTGNFFDYYFIDLLEGTADDEMAAAVLDNLGWKESDVYRVLALEACQRDSIDQTLSNLQIQMFEDQLKGKAFLYEDQLVVLINETAAFSSCEDGESREMRLRRTVKGILQQFEASGGYSETFLSLRRFRTYYLQARAAREYACRSGKSCQLLSYARIAVPYLASALYAHVPPELVCHPAVTVLRQYDRDNNGELLHTLRCYLDHEQNTQKTAQELYIHRNSLIYRLDRIQQLTNLDLSNPKERLRLSLSFFAPEPVEE